MHLKFVTVINMMTASQIHYLNLNYLLSTQWWGCIQKSKSWSNSCSALYRICLRRTCPNSSNKGNVAICFCIVGAWRQHLENKMFSILWKMHFFFSLLDSEWLLHRAYVHSKASFWEMVAFMINESEIQE